MGIGHPVLLQVVRLGDLEGVSRVVSLINHPLLLEPWNFTHKRNKVRVKEKG